MKRRASYALPSQRAAQQQANTITTCLLDAGKPAWIALRHPSADPVRASLHRGGGGGEGCPETKMHCHVRRAGPAQGPSTGRRLLPPRQHVRGAASQQLMGRWQGTGLPCSAEPEGGQAASQRQPPPHPARHSTTHSPRLSGGPWAQAYELSTAGLLGRTSLRAVTRPDGANDVNSLREAVLLLRGENDAPLLV